MSFSKKIDEWIKEAEARPESALTIMKLIARRLNDLTERNEELLAENIALQNGTRVEEYQKQIAHLEYQLDLLKRRFGASDISLVDTTPDAAETSTLNLLAHSAHGRIIRVEINSDVDTLGRITDEVSNDREPPRLLGIPSNEEVLLLFTSGRVSTYAVSNIPSVDAGGDWSWKRAALPDEPRAGELLACMMPLSHLPLSDFFLQVSRRGCVKKTMTSVAQSILDNHFLGRSALQKSDQPFDLTLCQKNERFAFVTHHGHLLGLDVDGLSYSAEERIHITATDYVVASFIPRPDESLLFVTQNGKVIHRESDSLELSKSPLAKGQALISPTRLEQGIRFIGAASVRDTDRIAVLDAEGNLSVHLAEAVTGAGSIEAAGPILSIGLVPTKARKAPNP
jgi:hypothetical protein